MTVKCKCCCLEIEDVGRDVKRVHFQPLADPSLATYERFSADPAGMLSVTIDNPAALKELQVGDAYYLYLTTTVMQPE